MTDRSYPNISRRHVLKGGVGSVLLVAGSGVAGAVSPPTGGVAYLQKKHRYGKNNPNETRYKIVGKCDPVTKTIACDSGRPRTYARYRIRCPNYPGGDPEAEGVDSAQHDDGCPGGDDGHDGGGDGGHCGRHVLVNPDRRVPVGLDQLYEFVVVRECDDTYVKAAFRPV